MVTTVAALRPNMHCWWEGEIYTVEWRALTIAKDASHCPVTVSLVHYAPRRNVIVTLDSSYPIIVCVVRQVRG